jgi:hypothetical protein
MEETLSYPRFIAYHRNQINPEPSPQSTLTFAYGEHRYVKMTEELRTSDNVLREKVVKEINEDFHHSDKINFALQSSQILAELVKCYRQPSDSIRELASRAVVQVAKTEMGRNEIVIRRIIEDEVMLFDDQQKDIRRNAYVCLINLAEFTFGVNSIIEFNVLPTLVDKLVLEKDEEILVLILTLLKILCEGEKAPTILLTTPVLARLNDHLQSQNKNIRELAALNLGSISYNARGKEKTIEAASIPPLCRMLFDHEEDVRTAATRGLASLAQLKAGKIEIFDLEMLDRVITLLSDPVD